MIPLHKRRMTPMRMSVGKVTISFCMLVSLASCGSKQQDDGTSRKVAHDTVGLTLRLGEVSRVENSPFVTIGIEAGDDNAGSYTKSSVSVRNRLIIDTRTGDSRRLLPDNSSEIVNWSQPDTTPTSGGREGLNSYSPEGLRSTGTGKLYYIAVVKRTGSQENGPPHYDLLLGEFASGRQQWIGRQFDGVDSTWLTTDGKFAYIATLQGQARFRTVDPINFKPIIDRPLAP
jgi:hypothetical protein